MSAGGYAQLAGAAFSVYSNHAAARAAKAEGRLAERAAELEADQMRRRAKQAFASGQRAAQDELRQAKLMQSRALMLAAVGGSASDPSIVNLLAGIVDEGAKRASLHMQAARQESGQLRLGALATQFGGQQANDRSRGEAKAYEGRAITTAASAGATFAKSRGWGGGLASNGAAKSSVSG